MSERDEYEVHRYRKLPVEITARRMKHPFEVRTLEGVVVGGPGDWLLTGVKGEHYPCRDDIFRATYEPADRPNGTIVLPSGPVEHSTLYSCDPDAERLTELDPGEALEELLRELDPEEWPTKVKVYGFRPMPVAQRAFTRMADSILEHARELWDDSDWADPEDRVRFGDDFQAALLAVCNAYLPRQPIWGHVNDPAYDVTIELLADLRELDDDRLDDDQRRFLALHDGPAPHPFDDLPEDDAGLPQEEGPA
jgi:hypothetical protein